MELMWQIPRLGDLIFQANDSLGGGFHISMLTQQPNVVIGFFCLFFFSFLFKGDIETLSLDQ